MRFWSSLLLLCVSFPAAGVPVARPNVVLVVVDALRADHVGTYGYDRHATTPNLDRFAGRSAVFEHTLAQAGWSVPSIASLFAGVDPQAHQVLRYDPLTRVEFDTLRDGETTLAEVLQGAGYQTAALKKSVVLDPARGMMQGFDVARIVGGDMAEGRSAGELTDAAIAWLTEERDPRRPTLLYLHYMDPHSSYRAPEPFYSRWTGGYRGALTGDHMEIERRFLAGGEAPSRADVRHLVALYDSEIAYWDEQFGRLMQHLVVSGLDTDTIVVVTADHGEAFHEHGQWFHGNVWLENLGVPLLVKAPGVAPARYAHWTQLIDVAPTIADLVGLPGGPRWMGRSQAGVLHGGPPLIGPVYGEFGGMQTLVTPDSLKLTVGDGAVKLYNLRRDPGERTDLGPVRGLLVDRLVPELEARVRLALALAPR